MTTTGAVLTNVTILRTLPLSGRSFRKGVTAPTDVTIGTTPTIGALLFDLVAELASTSQQMPVDWDSNTIHWMKSGRYPTKIKLLYLAEALPLPWFIKLIYAHLFYILARK